MGNAATVCITDLCETCYLYRLKKTSYFPFSAVLSARAVREPVICRTHIPETVLQTFPVVEQFDISEYVRLHLLYCIIFPPVCQLLIYSFFFLLYSLKAPTYVGGRRGFGRNTQIEVCRVFF